MHTGEVRSTEELRQACDDDALLVWAAQDFAPGVRAWRRGDAVAVASPFLSCRDRLAVRGPVRQVAALVGDVLPELGPTYRPIGEANLVTALPGRVPGLRLVRTCGWMETDVPFVDDAPLLEVDDASSSRGEHAASANGGDASSAGDDASSPRGGDALGGKRDDGPVDGKADARVGRRERRAPRARWLDERQWALVAELIQEAYPRSYARPGLAGVRRWSGSFDEEGRLAAVTAEAWSASTIGYLAGVVTRPSARRRGHGAAAFGLALNTLVAEYGRAGLMVATDNHAARAMYEGRGLRWRELAAACVAVTSSAA